MGLLTGGRVNCGKEPDQLDNVSQTEWGGDPEERERGHPWGRSGKTRAPCKVAPSGQEVHCSAERLLGRSGRVTRWPLLHWGFWCRTEGPLLGDPGPRGAGSREGVSCRRGRQRREHYSRKLKRKEARVRGGRPRGPGASARRVKPGSLTAREWEVRRPSRLRQRGRALGLGAAPAPAARGPPGS